MGVLYKHVMAAAYTAHSYGRPVIGNRADVERVPIDNLQAFYRKYYQPDNAILTVAGKVDEAKILAMVNDYFGAIPRPTRQLVPTYTTEPTQHGERTTTVRRVGDNQALMTVFHIPDGGHPDNAALNVLAGVLGEPASGRLYKALVDNKKATQVFAGSEQLNEPGRADFRGGDQQERLAGRGAADAAGYARRRDQGAAECRGKCSGRRRGS